MVSLEFLEEKEKRPHLPMHMQQGSTGLCSSGKLPLWVGFLRSGSPRTDRQDGRDWDRGGRSCPPGGACSILWQRFSEQLVLSKAFLQ